MRITIAPTASGVALGQHAASTERPDDELSLLEVVEMMAAALMAYGAEPESICAAFEHFALSHGLHTEVEASDEAKPN